MKRVLIIEDEPSIAKLQKDYLEINGFAVDIEFRGDSGLQRALKLQYDLIILDLMLPGMDGFEICRNIRDKKDTPILIVSARKEDVDIMRGLGLGADDYLTKPFNPSELIARVKAHLSRYERLVGKRVPKNERIAIRGLIIDKASRRVYINEEQEVVLTSKEFDLLAYLASNPDRVMTKDMLFDQIWGMDSTGDNATVTVHIGKVRDKIEFDSASPQYIETIWGVGYRFRA
ncbi:response regulator transcription factor [Paenibacillus sp. L3-i20]|uniref:response regulator transcription factor n=1 Tax=Paenibacillus sp. L3-i20 TaxID=2905833 RepID=UPI001EDF1D6E|nr:response regulator transcription factor [Paenibacillus sp. L3-i20]GKU77150.1 DNA-binding response regulator [Paenibacillus sp. L3-i20]